MIAFLTVTGLNFPPPSIHPGKAIALLAILSLLLVPIPAVQAASGRPISESYGPFYVDEDSLSLRLLNSPAPNPEQQVQTGRWELLRSDIITYTIQPGDNDWAIARRFDLDVDSLRYANDWLRNNPDLIFPGDKMVILPLKGAYVTVEEGDTVEKIALRYGVAPADIVDFPLNGLNGSDRLVVGQKLILPGGRLDYAQKILAPGPASGYTLAWPLRGVVSQGYHSGHQAIDIASYYGANVYASQDGRVKQARFSPGGWLGFTATIAGNDGVSTRYCHLSGLVVEPGQIVSRGQIIGQVGSTGNSTGPHVHFEVYQGGSVVNPLNLLTATAAE